MDFGLFYYCQGRGVPHDQAYHEMLDEIALAETLGFGEGWFAEHHCTDYSLLPSPNLMIASAVQRTSHVRFGNYVNAMSFHHPLRLAADGRSGSFQTRRRGLRTPRKRIMPRDSARHTRTACLGSEGLLRSRANVQDLRLEQYQNVALSKEELTWGLHACIPVQMAKHTSKN
jgi:hypothetical protein